MSIPIHIIMTFQFCYEEIVSKIKYIKIILSLEKYIANNNIWNGPNIYLLIYIHLEILIQSIPLKMETTER